MGALEASIQCFVVVGGSFVAMFAGIYIYLYCRNRDRYQLVDEQEEEDVKVRRVKYMCVCSFVVEVIYTIIYVFVMMTEIQRINDEFCFIKH